MRKKTIGSVTVYHGNVFKILPLIKGKFNAVITDPPYSSGGAFRSDRNQSTLKKYVMDKYRHRYQNFSGDNRDQLALMFWCMGWMSDLLEIAEPGGLLFNFIDWRGIPVIANSMQMGGWIWRGVMPWNKTEASRPQRGFFRSQCEYIMTGSAGSLGGEQARESDVCAPGFFTRPVLGKDKMHPSGKPLELMRDIISILPAESRVIDCFAGSGSTGIAAAEAGHECVLIEKDAHYFDLICKRLADHAARPVQPELI